MNYLLDTHTFLWSLQDRKKLSNKVFNLLKDQENTMWVSAVTYWEISLKYSIGKLNLKGVKPDDFLNLANKVGFSQLDLNCELVGSYYNLPKSVHTDPFDRMLIWQAIQNKYILISKDKAFGEYKKHGLKLLW